MKKLPLARLINGNEMASGICNGIADHSGIDVTYIRLLFLLTSVFSFGVTFFVYIVLAVIMPCRFATPPISSDEKY